MLPPCPTVHSTWPSWAPATTGSWPPPISRGRGCAVAAFERRDVPGGACVTEELWPGVRASPGAYTLSLLRTEIMAELDLAGHGLRVEVHEPYLFAPLPGRAAGGDLVRLGPHARAARARLVARGRRRLPRVGRPARAGRRARPGPLMLEPPDRERWLEAVGPELLEGAMADELAGIPSEEVRVPFAVQGLIGTLAGPVGSGHVVRGALPRPGRGGGSAGGLGLRPRRHGRGHARAALRRRGGRARRCTWTGRWSGCSAATARAAGVVLAGGDEVAARAVVSDADPLTTADAGRRGRRRPGWRQDGPVVKVMLLLDGLPDFTAWPGEEPWRGTIDIGYSLEDLQRAADDARAGRPAARRGSRPRARRRWTTRWRRRGGTCCRCSASAFRRTWTPRPRPTRPSPASRWCAPSCPTGSWTAWPSGPRELEARFGIRGGHIFHGEMLPGQLFERRPGRRALRRGSRASTWAGPARTRAGP